MTLPSTAERARESSGQRTRELGREEGCDIPVGRPERERGRGERLDLLLLGRGGGLGTPHGGKTPRRQGDDQEHGRTAESPPKPTILPSVPSGALCGRTLTRRLLGECPFDVLVLERHEVGIRCLTPGRERVEAGASRQVVVGSAVGIPRECR